MHITEAESVDSDGFGKHIPGLLLARAGEAGSSPFISFDTSSERVTWTFAETATRAAEVAAALKVSGVDVGDRVAIMCDNGPEPVAAFLGTVWLGAVAVPVNTAFRGEQLEHVLANAGAKLLVCDAQLVTRFRALPGDRLRVERVWTVGVIPDAPGDVYDGPARRRRLVIEEFPASGATQLEPQHAAPGSVAAILYTSGTTGLSKGVICPQEQFYWWAVNSTRILEITRDDVLHTTLPLFHVNALATILQGLLCGARVVVARRFSASAFWTQLARSGATVTYILGAMASILLSKPPTEEERGHSVRLALAPAVPAELHPLWHARTGVQLLEGYASTETNFAIAAQPDEQRAGFMGYTQPGFDALVVDDDGRAVPDGRPGELLIRPANPLSVSAGYYGLPDTSARSWRNGWFHTGDGAIREPDGWFRFVGRLTDSIRRRGENISAVEVERAICSHPEISGVAVFGVPSEMGEDEVMAAIIPRPGRDLDPAEVVAHCEQHLAHFAIPRFIDIVNELPLTENGKIQKFQLKKSGVTDSTWDRERNR